MARWSNVPVKLEWVLVEDVPFRVSEFAGVRPSERPVALCPECGRRLSMKLGDKTAHHAAHRPGAICALQSGESAVHLNSKMHLAAHLRQASRVEIRETCQSSGCKDTRVRRWASEYDEVLVEAKLDTRRPDVLLKCRGAPLAAIEVCVSNAVNLEKRADLARMALPWIEVRGTPELYGVNGWRADQPLAVLTADEPWTCERCLEVRRQVGEHFAAHARADEEARARVSELRRETEAFVQRCRNDLTVAAESGWIVRVFRIYDFYYSSEKTYREKFFVLGRRERGVTVECLVVRRKRLSQPLGRWPPPFAGSLRKRVQHAVDEHLAQLPSSSIADSPMEWLEFPPPDRLPASLLTAWCRELGLQSWWRRNASTWGAASPEHTHLMLADFLAGAVRPPRRYRWGRYGRWFLPRQMLGFQWNLDELLDRPIPPGGFG